MVHRSTAGDARLVAALEAFAALHDGMPALVPVPAPISLPPPPPPLDAPSRLAPYLYFFLCIFSLRYSVKAA